MQYKLILLGILIFVVTACATLDKNECASADWQSIGFQDALAGLTVVILDEHNKACSNYAVAADQDKYQLGYDAGLVEFCTPQNAIQYGRLGRAYHGACPDDQSVEFLISYESGYSDYIRSNRVTTQLDTGWKRKVSY